MNEPQIFKDMEFGTLRILQDENGEPLFIGKEVAEMLGYSDTAKSIKMHVDDEDKQIRQFVVSGQNRNMTVINESGLYSLILSSKLPTAKKFKRWVTAEVLPSIRRHGAYMTAPTIEAILQDPKLVIGLAQELDKEQQARRQLEIKVKEDAGKVMFAEAVAITENTILIRELAKIMKQNGIDIGEKRLFEYLRKQGYLCRSGDSYNKPTQKAMNLGLFKIAETVVHRSDGTPMIKTTSKVTGKGQLYFLNKLQMTEFSMQNVL